LIDDWVAKPVLHARGFHVLSSAANQENIRRQAGAKGEGF